MEGIIPGIISTAFGLVVLQFSIDFVRDKVSTIKIRWIVFNPILLAFRIVDPFVEIIPCAPITS